MSDLRKLNTIQKRENLNAICAVDEVGPGGANHEYEIRAYGAGIPVGNIQFQKGPRNLDTSVSGVIDTDLLEIVRDRLISFQAGDFASEYNAQALLHVEEALMWLNRRVEDRIERQVLGTNNK